MLNFNGNNNDTTTDDESSYDHQFTFYNNAHIDADYSWGQTFNVTASSGLSVTGESAEIGEFAETAASEITISGSSSEIGEIQVSAASELSISGTPSETAEFIESAESGLSISDEPTGATSDLVESGMSISGQASETGEFPESALSGVVISGTASETGEFPKTVESGMSIDGVPTETAVFEKTVTSGLVISGSVHRTYDLESSSGLEISGEPRGYLAIDDNCAAGQYRIADNSLEHYKFYRGIDAEPDLEAAPFTTFASLPQTLDIFDKEYISPDSYEDESGGWSNETNTSAESIEIAYDEGTGWLHFKLDQPTACDKIEIDVSKSNGDADPVPFEIYGYWLEEWHAIYSGAGCWEEGLQELSLGGIVPLEEIKLDFRNDDEYDTTYININNIKFHRVILGISSVLSAVLNGEEY